MVENITTEIYKEGFIILPNVYAEEETENILSVINSTDTSNPTFKKTKDLFAIRQFLKEIPEIVPLIFNEKLKALIKEIFGANFFVIKSIYFISQSKVTGLWLIIKTSPFQSIKKSNWKILVHGR